MSSINRDSRGKEISRSLNPFDLCQLANSSEHTHLVNHRMTEEEAIQMNRETTTLEPNQYYNRPKNGAHHRTGRRKDEDL